MRRNNKIKDFLSTLLLLGGMAVSAAWLARQNEVTLLGQYKIIDGDSLVVNGQEIRLLGIDAPEYRQMCVMENETSYPCGKQSRSHLSRLAKKGKLECKGWEEDKYQRLLAICTVNELELNVQMVIDGWAVSYGDYGREEASAKKRKIGIWKGGFESPSTWRSNEGERHSVNWLSKFSLW